MQRNIDQNPQRPVVPVRTVNPAAPVGAQRPVAPATVSTGAVPRNLPKVKVRPYTPPKPQGGFEVGPPKWITEEAAAAYDAILPRTEKDYYYAWIPMPMFNSQNQVEFGETRFPGDETEFNEWAYCTSLVVFAGTNRKITFCPYTGPPNVGDSDEFISSPYVQLLTHIKAMHKEKPFAKASDPGATSWWHLVEFDSRAKRGNLLPNTRRFYLMLSIMLQSVTSSYNRDSKQTLFTTEDHYNPAYLGKGLGDDGTKLTIMAVSNQVFEDLAGDMNAQTADGNFNFPNACDPERLAVFYAWNHKTSATVPVPGKTNSKELAGMTGAVSGVYYGPRMREIGRQFKLPRRYVTAAGGPSDAYFERVPLHIGDCINYMDAFTQVKELAVAYADARSLFELAYRGTQFEEMIEEPEVQNIFGRTQQKFVYDSTIHVNAPVSVRVQTPQQMAHTPAPPAYAPVPPAHTSVPPAHSNSVPPAYPQSPVVQVASVVEEGVPIKTTRPVEVPAPNMVIEDANGYAMDNEGFYYTDDAGELITMVDMYRKMEANDWNA